MFACLFSFDFNYSRKFSIQEPDPEILSHLKHSNNVYTSVVILKKMFIMSTQYDYVSNNYQNRAGSFFLKDATGWCWY